MRPIHQNSWIGLLVGICLLLTAPAISADDAKNPPVRPKLVKGVICERIEDYKPVNAAIAFPIEIGQISCFTSFEDIGDTTYILHKWYRRGSLVTSKRLTLKPPSWSTYSSIQLREADKGPWRVDIYNASNELLKTLRFSVVD